MLIKKFIISNLQKQIEVQNIIPQIIISKKLIKIPHRGLSTEVLRQRKRNKKYQKRL